MKPDRRWRTARQMAGALLAIALWEAIEWLVGARFPIVPAPSAIVLAVIRHPLPIWLNLRTTVVESSIGFGLGTGVGVALALLFVLWPAAESALYNLVVTVHSIPLLAVAPLLIIWFGTGSKPVIVIAALACFFLTIVNVSRGLRAADPQALDMMRLLNAGWFRTAVQVRLPAALPFLVTALKQGAPAAVLGATVGEWLGTQGLGYLLFSSMVNFDVPMLWATMAICSAVALVGFGAFALAERRFLSWHASARSAAAT